jgi:hypothetical protein
VSEPLAGTFCKSLAVTFVIDAMPETHQLAGDPNNHRVQAPPIRLFAFKGLSADAR